MGRLGGACCCGILLCPGAWRCPCKREERDYGATPPEVEVPNSLASARDRSGPRHGSCDTPSPAGTQPWVSPPIFRENYEKNAFALSEGQQLFEQYNCITCHAHGGEISARR